MEIQIDTRIGDIVKGNFKAAQVFEKNKINFCCGGAKTLAEACEKTNTNLQQIIDELEVVVLVNDNVSKKIDALALDEMCDYIEKKYHASILKKIPFLQQHLQKLYDVHGDNHPELFEVKELFEVVAVNLKNHLKEETEFIFPYIRDMVICQKECSKGCFEVGYMLESFVVLDDENQNLGERFREMAELTNGYAFPSDGCNTFEITYETLRNFEKDLHLHLHLENNILFKKAFLLENILAAVQN